MKRISEECLKEVGAVLLKHGFKQIATSVVSYGPNDTYQGEVIILSDTDAGMLSLTESAWGIQKALRDLGIRPEMLPESLQPFPMPSR